MYYSIYYKRNLELEDFSDIILRLLNNDKKALLDLVLYENAFPEEVEQYR